MKLKNKLKKLLVVTLAAGITVTSIPLPSYAATISQTDSDLAMVMEEDMLQEPEVQTDIEEETAKEPQTETQTGTESQNRSETETESGEESHTANETESESETAAETETESETTGETESEIETESEPESETEQETETEIETETETETEDESEPDQLDEQLQILTEEAKAALKELVQSEYIMALVYLCDSYEVKEQPDFESPAVATLKSGHTVFIKDIEADPETGTIWYQVSFYIEENEYTGYISKDYLAYSNENFIAWEKMYVEPIVQLFEQFGGSTVYVGNDGASNTYSNDVAQFPASYQAALQSLKNSHPNWTFVKFDTGLDWNTVVSAEMVGARSLVYYTAKDAWKKAKYDNNWYYASEGAVKYCLDPRNGITENRIFQFEQLTFNASYHNADAIQNILNNTFMKGIVPQSNVSYATAFYNIGKNRGISPFHLASRVLQEQGVNGGSPLISGTYPGYEGYYNYFNIGATSDNPIINGLKYAKQQGWTTPYLSLNGGAQSIGNGYILKGQDTLYLQKWDVDSATNVATHQYMQNIQAPNSEASTIRSLYNQAGALGSTFVFKIPTYNNMPDSASPDPSIEKITLSTTAVELKGGYTANVTYSLANAASSQSTVSWKVENTSIIKAEQVSGKQEIKITALKPGTTNIKFTSSGGASATCKVTVLKDTITLSKSTLKLTAGSTDGTISGNTVEITYTIGNPKSKVLSCKADNPEVVEVEKLSEVVDTGNNKITGKIRLKALAGGTAKVKITSKYGGSATCTVTVIRLPEKIEMDAEVTVSVGNSKTTHYKVLPEDTTNKNLEWKSSDENIAKINPSTGYITGVSSGKATITATTQENDLSGKKVTATCEVTVVPAVASIEIAANEAELLLDETTAETLDLDGKIYVYKTLGEAPSLQDENQKLYSVSYNSSDESIVTVNENGLIVPVGIGNVIITATVKDAYSASGTKTAKCKVSVVPERKGEVIIPEYDYIQPDEIRLYPAGADVQAADSYTMTAGEYLDLNYEVVPENASVESITWESSKDSVACADGLPADMEPDTEDSVSTEKNKGTVRITAKTKGNAVITVSTNTGIKKQINITVKEKTVIDEITLDKTSALIYANGTVSGNSSEEGTKTMPAVVLLTVSPESVSDNDIRYNWTSTDETVAVVDENGKVTAKAPGTTVITVEDRGGSGKYAQCTVTVESCLEEIKTNVDKLWLQPGKKVTVGTMLLPANATSQNLEWKSSDESIATVTAKGVVSAAKTAGVGKTATISVTDTITDIKKEIPLTITGTSCAAVTVYEKDGENRLSGTSTLYRNGSGKEGDKTELIIRATGNDKSKEVINELTFYAVSSNEKIAVVEPWQNAEGQYDGTFFKITAKEKGTATIKLYAADGSGKSTSLKVTVKVHPESVSMQKEALYLTPGANGTLSAAVFPKEANEKGVTWKFKDDKEAVGFKIDAKTGKVKVIKGTAVGTTAEFVAVTKDGGVVSDPCKVTVIDTKVSKVKLNTSSAVMIGSDIEKIEPVQLTATVTPAGAHSEAAKLKAVSSNENVVIVEQNKDAQGEYDGTFRLKAVGYGTATVTVQTLDNSKKAVCKVYVSSLEKAYKLSAVSSKVNIQNYDLDVNSSSTLKIKDQFGNILDNSLFTFSSNKTDIAVVDEKGIVRPNKSFGTAKNGKATITAALTGDPYNRKVKFTVNVLSKEQVESVSVTALKIWQDGLEKDLENPESFSVKYPITEDTEGNVTNTITLKAQSLNVYGDELETKLKWSVSDTSVASIKVSADTKEAALTVKKAGKFYITCTANDTLKKSRKILITAIDAKPVFGQNKFTINKQTPVQESVNGNAYSIYSDSVHIAENKDSLISGDIVTIKSIKKGKEEINPTNFRLERTSGSEWKMAVFSDNAQTAEKLLKDLSTGNYTVILSVKTKEIPEIGLTGTGQDGTITHEIPITLSIVDKKPKVSIKTVSINRQNITDLEAALLVTAPDEVENIEPVAGQSNQFDKRFEIKKTGDGYRLVFKDITDYTSKSITGKVSVTVKGYLPVVVNLKVNTPLTKAVVQPSVTPAIDTGSGNSQKISLYNKTTKQNLVKYKVVSVPSDAKLEITNKKEESSDYLLSNVDGTLTIKPKKGVKYKNGGTVSVTIKVMAVTSFGEDGVPLWASPVDVKLSVKTYTAAPTVNLGSSTLTLNKQAAKEKVETAIGTNRSNVRIADDEEWEISRYDSKTKKYTVVKAVGQKAENIEDDIVLSYNRQYGTISACMKENADIKTGSYKYRITWIAEDYSTVKRELTVKVIDKKISAKITAKGKLDLLARADATMQATISLTNIKGKVESITMMELDQNGEYRRNSYFYSAWLNDNTFRIKLRAVAEMTTGKKTVPVKIVLEGGTELYANVSFKVTQNTPKVKIPKAEIIYKSEKNATVVYDMNEQIPSGYEISTMKAVSVPSGIGVTVKDGRLSVSLTDRSLKPGTYNIKVNMYFKGAQYVFGSGYGKAYQKTLKVTIKE